MDHQNWLCTNGGKDLPNFKNISNRFNRIFTSPRFTKFSRCLILMVGFVFHVFFFFTKCTQPSTLIQLIENSLSWFVVIVVGNNNISYKETALKMSIDVVPSNRFDDFVFHLIFDFLFSHLSLSHSLFFFLFRSFHFSFFSVGVIFPLHSITRTKWVRSFIFHWMIFMNPLRKW